MLKVLLIEPSSTIRHIQQNALLQHGYDVDTAEDFAHGLKLLESGENSGDGYEAFVLGWPTKQCPESERLLESLFSSKHSSRVILILAQDIRPDVKECVARYDNVIHIPWNNYKLSGTLLANHYKRLSGNTQESDEAAINPIRILFVDDSRTVRFKYKSLLVNSGYKVEVAESVDAGFEKAIDSDFDIAIIDYFMPDANGDVLCKKLLNDPRTNSITSALLTGTYIDYAIESSLKSGAVEVMFKNESDKLFLARVDAMSRHIRTRKSIEKDRKHLSGILHSVGDGVYGADNNGRISFTNPACLQILGFDLEDNINGKHAFKLFHFTDDDGNQIEQEQSQLHSAYINGHTINNKESIFWNKDGESVPVEYTIYPFSVEAKREGSVVVFRDISERKLFEDKLRWEADHDPLTDLFNRRCFENKLNEEIDRIKRIRNYGALLYIDLDRFKYVNDTAGHAAGDQLLIEISQLLSTRLRKTDCLARMGGDEFAIILSNVTKIDVMHTAEKYRCLLEKYVFSHNGKQFNINASIGVAGIEPSTKNAETVLSEADLACHIAKKQGRNQIHLYIPSEDADKDKDLSWSKRINVALEENQFLLHYHPILECNQQVLDLVKSHRKGKHPVLLGNIPSSEMCMEILLRMQENRDELIYPDAFLPTAERLNLMSKIDPWVVKQSLSDLKQLQDNGYQGGFSINLSNQTVAEPHIVDSIEAIIVESGLDTSKIVFEISETGPASTSFQASELVYRLNNLGCKVALDDFGSGFFSFTHMKQMAVDYIKISSHLVLEADNNEYVQEVIKSINSVAHSLNMKTIAKHVETIETLEFLVAAGIDYVQGLLFSKPVPVSSIDRLTTDKNGTSLEAG